MDHEASLHVNDELEIISRPGQVCGEVDIVIRLEAIGDGMFGSKHFETALIAPSSLRMTDLEGSGIVTAKGQHVNHFNVGDEVLALLTASRGTKAPEVGSEAVVKTSMACHKPTNIPFSDAANLLIAFVTATRVVRKALALPTTWPQIPLEEAETSPRRFCIFGGNTTFGASTLQLLRHLFRQARIVTMIYGATATEDNRQALLQDAFLMLNLGSSYAIDGANSLSLDCLEFDSQEPPEVVISFPHPSDLDAEILAHFGGPRVYSMSEDDISFTASTATADEKAIQHLGELLKDEKFKVAFPASMNESHSEAADEAS